ncbi:hypothetical protein Q644_22120 [Brucella intermedia 229E]|uniref:Uncharacterized protein n=1 Tax=Brucella intermedia 229E TaxID=1337887 RepID=U4V9N0_9HYPH|nr:hypothetical protein Q644_22120 [Brucella intermedia 229E]
MPHVKQRELQRVLEVIFEEFEDALKEGSAEFKKRGRIVKVNCPPHFDRTVGISRKAQAQAWV